MDEPTNRGDIAAAIQAGRDHIVMVPPIDGFKRHAIAAGKLLELVPDKMAAPRFLTAAPKFHDVVAFIAYFNQFKDSGSRIFYTQEGAFIAVLDFHQFGPPCARHGDHVAVLVLKRSPEWETWAKYSGQQMGQQAFAEFIEDNAADIVEPDPISMLRVASGLHATVGATFRQVTNQANGQINVSFDETINGTVNGKDETIPAQFKVGLRPFMGCHRYPVDCRLRYRIDRSSGATLKLHFKALHLDPITDAALVGIVDKVRDETGIMPALGDPNTAAIKCGV